MSRPVQVGRSDAVLFCYHPPSEEELEKLAPPQDCGVLALSGGPGATLRERLRLARTRRQKLLLVPADDPALLPLTAMASLLIPADRRALLLPGGRIIPLDVVRLASFAIRLCAAFALSLLALPWAWITAIRLRRAPRSPNRAGKGPALYVRTVTSGTGGATAHAAGVIGGLASCGVAVRMLTVEAAPRQAQSDRVVVESLSPTQPRLLPRELSHLLTSLELSSLLPRRVPGPPPRFIYHRLCLASLPVVLLARRLRVPLALEYNGSESWMARHWGPPLRLSRLFDRLEDSCLRHADLVVTVSEPLERELAARGIPADRIVVQPNGVDPSIFDPARFSAADHAHLRQSLGIPPEAIVAGFVGTFGPWHGAEILAKAMTRIPETEPLHALFIGDGARRRATEAIIGGGTRATFTGSVAPDQIPALLAASDILVSPHVPNPDGSPFFGSPTKLFEYLAMGRPVIGSRLGQIAESLAGCPGVEATAPPEGACGVLVTPGDPDELARALVILARSADWRRQAGANARARAIRHHSWAAHVQAILDRLGATPLCYPPLR